MTNIKFRRSGDVNLIPIDKIPEGVKEVKHQGSFVLARGEATGSVHELKVKNPANLIIRQDEKGIYFELLEEGTITHTRDHETITIEPGIYKQEGEREVDWFAEGVERKVQD